MKNVSSLRMISIFSGLLCLSLLSFADCPKSDPWDPVTNIQGGAYDGECIVTDLQRPITVLSDTLIANFRHEKKFWIASLSNISIASVSFETQPIPGQPFHHVRVRFQLSKPLNLIWDQSQGAQTIDQLGQLSPNASTVQIDDFVTSIETGFTTSTDGQPWNPDLQAGSYPLIARFASYSSLSEDPVGPPANGIVALDYSGLGKQTKDATKAATDQQVLMAYIKYSNDIGLTQKYDAVTHNCANEALHVLDGLFVSYYAPNVYLTSNASKALDDLPNIIFNRLHYRGLIANLPPATPSAQQVAP